MNVDLDQFCATPVDPRHQVYFSLYPHEEHRPLLLTKKMFDQIVEFYHATPTPPDLKLVED